MRTIIVVYCDYELNSCWQASWDENLLSAGWKNLCLHVYRGGSGWCLHIHEAEPISIFVLFEWCNVLVKIWQLFSCGSVVFSIASSCSFHFHTERLLKCQFEMLTVVIKELQVRWMSLSNIFFGLSQDPSTLKQFFSHETLKAQP